MADPTAEQFTCQAIDLRDENLALKDKARDLKSQLAALQDQFTLWFTDTAPSEAEARQAGWTKPAVPIV